MYGQDDKFAKKKVVGQLLYYYYFLYPRLLQVSPHTHTELRQKLKKAEHKTAFCPETNTSNCFARIFMMSQDIIHIGNAKIHTICGTTLYINKGILSFFLKTVNVAVPQFPYKNDSILFTTRKRAHTSFLCIGNDG